MSTSGAFLFCWYFVTWWYSDWSGKNQKRSTKFFLSLGIDGKLLYDNGICRKTNLIKITLSSMEVNEIGESYTNEIASLQNDIYLLTQKSYQKREDLERLERVLAELMDHKTEFQHYNQLCVTPRLSINTWYGHMAKDFQSFQEHETLRSYESISDHQLNRTLTQLKDEIQVINQTILDLQGVLSAKDIRLSHVIEQQRKG
ncbi:DUF5082 family protein [Virgibacillus necropolis]|uniref:Uncharacterized protein n=1 Tax=Virgibacillus necropolis TaxID=163877 RepID=A0A221M9A3_9BACI|nr:DUF5082 family protein [Virgibacillus necropolis]ASN04215.1 hypothetical protein CFK40_03930 [Virgibacillus necropolis]